MEEVDKINPDNNDEDYQFLCEMCGDDHDLLFLDSYLRDTFGGGKAYESGRSGAGYGGESGRVFNEEATI